MWCHTNLQVFPRSPYDFLPMTLNVSPKTEYFRNRSVSENQRVHLLLFKPYRWRCLGRSWLICRKSSSWFDVLLQSTNLLFWEILSTKKKFLLIDKKCDKWITDTLLRNRLKKNFFIEKWFAWRFDGSNFSYVKL